MLSGPLNIRCITPKPLELELPDGSKKTQGVWSYWIRSSQELPEIARAWDEEADVYFCPQAVQHGDHASGDTITHMSALGMDLDFELAQCEYEPQELLKRCRKLDLPELTAVVSTGGGYHAFFIYAKPIYTGPRRGEDRQRRLGKLERLARWHKDTAANLCQLFSDLGADPSATDLPHIFRLPGFRSVKRGLRVEVVHLNPHSRPSLGEISKKAAAALKKHRRPAAPFRQLGLDVDVNMPKTPPPAGILKTEGYRWLRGSHFARGNRNQAYLALAACLRMAGWEYAKSWIELTRWRRENTLPTYPEAEARRVLRAIYRHGYGLDKVRLLEIQNRNGETMGEQAADGLILSMPPGARRQAQRRNLPLIAHVGRVLSYLLKSRVISDTPISAAQLAQDTGLSEKQVERVEDFFTKIGMRTVKRSGRSFVSTYNLTRLKCSPLEVIYNFGEWRGYVEDFKLWLWRWWRRLRGMMQQLQAVLYALAKLLFSPSGSESHLYEGVGARRLALGGRGLRGPPGLGVEAA